MAAPQAFYTYEQLGRMWQVQPDTVRKWIQELRRARSADVWITYRLVRGYQRTALVAASTVRLLQDAHFPKGGEHPKRPGSGLDGLRPSPYQRRQRAQTLATPPSPRPPRSPRIGAPRRLALPVMLARDGVLQGTASARGVE